MPSHAILSRNRLLIAIQSCFALAARAGVVIVVDGPAPWQFRLVSLLSTIFKTHSSMSGFFPILGPAGLLLTLARYAQSVATYALPGLAPS